MKKRIAKIDVFRNKELNGNNLCFGISKDSDDTLVNYVIERAHWMIKHATGECEIYLHINPDPNSFKIIKKGESCS